MNHDRIVDALGALSHRTRLEAVRYLVGRGAEGASAGDIAGHVGAEPSKMSFHLSALTRAGLLESERLSRRIVYRVDFSALGGVISFLLNDCCDNHPDVLACCGTTAAGCCDSG